MTEPLSKPLKLDCPGRPGQLSVIALRRRRGCCDKSGGHTVHNQSLEWVHHFARHLATERQVSLHTTSNYLRDIKALVAFCDEKEIHNWRGLRVPEVRSFAAQSHARGLSPQSVQRRLSAVRTFMRYLMREGVIGDNVAEVVQAPKSARRLPTVFDADQMGRLIEIPEENAFAVRDRAIMELLYSSALRLSELAGLDLGDVDLGDRAVTVVGKGNAMRIVPVGSVAIGALRRWLNARRKIASKEEKAMFVGRGGRRLGGRAIQLRVKYWGRRQGIATDVFPHMFRHACATHLLESSGSMRDVQELLGHVSISTTQIYTHLNAQHLLNVYEKAHPRARRVKETNEGT